MFLLVSSLGSKTEAVAEVVADISRSMRLVEPPESDPSHQEKEKVAPRNVSFAKGVDEKEGETTRAKTTTTIAVSAVAMTTSPTASTGT